MAQLTLTVDMIVDIPNQPFTAKLTRVVNSDGHDITAIFSNYCAAQGLSLSSQVEIELAAERFTDAHQSNFSILP